MGLISYSFDCIFRIYIEKSSIHHKCQSIATILFADWLAAHTKSQKFLEITPIHHFYLDKIKK